MTTPTQPRRRISNIRFVSRVEPRRAGISPLMGLAALTAAGIALTLLAVTIAAAQSMQ